MTPRLKKRLENVPLKEMPLKIKDRIFSISYTDDLDTIVEDMTIEDFGEDERFPYFIHIWEAGPILGEYFLESNIDLKGKTVLELGSGTGVGGVLIGSSGCKIIFSDYEEISLKICRLNATKNDVKNFETLLADWRNFPEIDEKIDYVVGADIVYENKQVEPLFNVLSRFLNKGSQVFIADPNRGFINQLLEMFTKNGFKYTVVYEKQNLRTKHRNVKVYNIYK